ARPGSDSAAWQGARAMLPWLVGIAPLGMIVGATAAANELSVAIALMSGALIFNGPAQLTALELLGEGAGIVAVVATVVLMSVHLLILGSSIAPHWRGTPLRFRLLASSVLIDPTFIEGDRRYRSGLGGGHAYYLGAAAALAIAWHLAILVGALLGEIVPTSVRLEWVLPLFLLAELVQRLQTSSMLVVAAVGGCVAYLARSLPMNGGVLVATLSAVAMGVVVARRTSRASGLRCCLQAPDASRCASAS
ncbi:MAG TPA: AzlC family ABC transporter permease, partial [Ilumatobacteraceae bacterium]|nr:AzlC family ABC transporter permease [Ilumatobacteraceae bacterium]